jgi:hypothetical protein
MSEEVQGSSNTGEIVRLTTIQVMEQVGKSIGEKLNTLDAAYASALEKAQRDAAANLEGKGADLVQKLSQKDTAAAAHLAAINTSKGAAEQASKQIETLGTQSKTALDTTNQNRDTVVSLGKRAEELNKEITSLQEQVRTARTNAEKHEKDWDARYKGLFATIEGLLPGATGAGLASGFRDEKLAYEDKQRNANWVFIGCLVVLVLTIGLTPLQLIFGHAAVDGTLDAQDFLRKALWNLPLVAPAIWGAWWFNRRANIYDQLAEEYRQKEAISKAFEGYTHQLVDLDQIDSLKDYLAKALKEICVPPGRIYDKKQPAGSPLEDNLDKFIDAVIRRKPPTSGV